MASSKRLDEIERSLGDDTAYMYQLAGMLVGTQWDFDEGDRRTVDFLQQRENDDGEKHPVLELSDGTHVRVDDFEGYIIYEDIEPAGVTSRQIADFLGKGERPE